MISYGLYMTETPHFATYRLQRSQIRLVTSSSVYNLHKDPILKMRWIISP